MGQVKMKNRSVILHCINKAGAISRKDIAEQTGLTAAAVTLICNDFIESGLLVEGESVKKAAGTGAGRRKVLVSLDYKLEYFFAIAIESDKTVIAITDMQGHLIQKTSIATAKNIRPEEFLSEVAAQAKKLSESCDKTISSKIKHGAVSIPGIVNKKKGNSIAAYGIWNEEVPVCKILKEKLNVKFAIENNVTAFANAEQIYGTGREQENVMIIKWGPGVGAATFVDNDMHLTQAGRSAEIGHFIVDPNGKQCVCGRRGCLETFVSAEALSKMSKEDAFKAIDMFAVTIVNILTVLQPDRIILYGKLAQNEEYRIRLQDSCKKLAVDYDEKTVRYTKLTDCEEFIGPAAVAMESFVFQGK